MRKMTGTGVPNVLLIDGTDEHVNGGVSYRDLDGLYVALADAIAARVTSLTPGELRFLRKRMNWTQEQLGSLGDKSGQVAAMWEKGTRPVPVAESKLLRLSWLSRRSKRHVAAAVLAMEAGDSHFEPCAYVLRHVEGEGWREDIAAAQAMANAQATARTEEAIANAMNGAARHYTHEMSAITIVCAVQVIAADVAPQRKLFT